MRFPLLILLLPTVGWLMTGCASSDPVRFESKVREWVPLGTPVPDAERIMERHGFECHRITANNPFNSSGIEYLDCDKEQVRFHDWSARFVVQDGRVSAYGPITASKRDGVTPP